MQLSDLMLPKLLKDIWFLPWDDFYLQPAHRRNFNRYHAVLKQKKQVTDIEARNLLWTLYYLPDDHGLPDTRHSRSFGAYRRITGYNSYNWPFGG